MIIRTQQAIIRSVGAVTGQFATWLGDGISYLRDKTGENKAYFKQSSIGLGLSALFAGGATWWQLQNLHGLENTAVAEGLVVGNAAPKDLPEGAKLLAETDKGGRAYQLGDRVIFEENGKVAHNIGKSAFDNYKGDASDENFAAKLLASDEAKQAKAAEGLVVGSAAPKDLPEGAKLLAETDKGGRAYQLGDRVIFEENGKVAHNYEARNVKGYADDASKQNWAKRILEGDEAKQAEVAASKYTFKLADLTYTDEATEGLRADKWDDTMKILLDLPYGKNTPKLDIEALTEDQKDVLKEIMEHAHQAMKEHPKAFEGLTDKQAIFAAVQITSWQGVATEVKGNIIRNVGEVIFKTGDADKDAAYTAFVKMILCGKKTNLPDGVLNDTAKLIQPDGSMTGVVGKNLVRFKLDTCGEQVWIIDGHKVVKKVVKQISEQPTTREVLSETQQVVEAPTTSEVISEDTKPIENNEYVVRKVRYVNKSNADTQLGDQDLNGHIKFKGSYSVAGKGESR
jgi:plastocyanin